MVISCGFIQYMQLIATNTMSALLHTLNNKTGG